MSYKVLLSVYDTPPIFSTLSRMNFVKGEVDFKIIGQREKILLAYPELVGIIRSLSSKLSKLGFSSQKYNLEELDKIEKSLVFNYIAGDADIIKETLDFYLNSKAESEEDFAKLVIAYNRSVKYLLGQKTRIRTAVILVNSGHTENLNLSREFLAEIRFWRSNIEAEIRQYHVLTSQNILIQNKNKLSLLYNKCKHALFFHFLDKNNLSALIKPSEKTTMSRTTNFRHYLCSNKIYFQDCF